MKAHSSFQGGWLLLFAITSLTANPSAAQEWGTLRYYSEIPDVVWRLLQWPDAGVISNRQVSASTLQWGPAPEAERWVRLVIDPKCLPAELTPLCIARDFDGEDVIRYRWVKGGRRFLVAQMRHTFVLEIKPETGPIARSRTIDLATVREICEDVFAKSGERYASDHQQKVPVPGLNTNILEFSFTTNSSAPESGRRMIGWPYYSDDELVAHQKGGAEVQSDPNWPKSWLAWSYWFRNVRWIADRDRVIVFFLKQEEQEQIPPWYGSDFDRFWFKGWQADPVTNRTAHVVSTTSTEAQVAGERIAPVEMVVVGVAQYGELLQGRRATVLRLAPRRGHKWGGPARDFTVRHETPEFTVIVWVADGYEVRTNDFITLHIEDMRGRTTNSAPH